ncbi:hypothetical protein D1AOALGA4SA_8844 [Olavius algarvensis Delta 1 endosymbiont]|nr:hypothetical protein D1AOALGA4SA_8844 [Olavius algarvensis Delta 1 endosymbiont]
MTIATFTSSVQVSGVRKPTRQILTPPMKLHENLKTNRRISNKKYRMMKCGIASL